MRITIHRGAEQIGGSCVELRSTSGDRILLDAGMPLTRKDGIEWPRGTMSRKSSELRAEGVLPDIAGLYAGEKPGFRALVLSHAHLDHHGLAHHVHPDIPVYASRGTIEMLKVSRIFIPDAAIPADLRELSAGAISIEPFTVTGIPVDHVAPDSRALLIEAGGQRILYSGDLRAHGRQSSLFDELPAAAGRVDVLLLEGTTIGQVPGSHGLDAETDVEKRLGDLLKRDTGIVVVVASGQNIDRAISVYRAAIASDRELVIDAYQAYVMTVLKDVCPQAPQADSPSVRVKFVKYHVEKLKEAGFWSLVCKMSRNGKVSAEQLAANPRRFVYLARSNNATVALLNYLARTTRPILVWSQWSGYLKKDGALQRFCSSNNIKPILIHSGGHAHPEDLVNLVNRLRPRVVVPIHTEGASKYADIMPNVRVVNDGETVDIASLLA